MEKNVVRHITCSFDAEEKMYHINLNDNEIEQALLDFRRTANLCSFNIKGSIFPLLLEGFEKNVRKGISLAEEELSHRREENSYCDRFIQALRNNEIKEGFIRRKSYLCDRILQIEKALKAYSYLLSDCEICQGLIGTRSRGATPSVQ